MSFQRQPFFMASLRQSAAAKRHSSMGSRSVTAWTRLGGRRSSFHQDAFGPDARATGSDDHAFQTALQRQEGVEIPGVLVVGQRQEHMGFRTGRAHSADEPVQRGRSQVKAVEKHAGLLQKAGLGGAIHGLRKFRFSILKATFQQFLIGLQYDPQVVQLHAQQAVGLFGAGKQPIRGQPGLANQLQLAGAALRKAPAPRRAVVQLQPLVHAVYGGAHQHDPPPLVHPHAFGLSRGLEYAIAQPLGTQYLQTEGTLQRKRCQQYALGLQRQLLGNHDDVVRVAGSHALAHNADHGRFHQPAAAGVDAHGKSPLFRQVSANIIA